MRIQDKSIILLSEDLSTDPKQIRFKSDSEDIDISSLVQSKTVQEVLPVGIHNISLGNISQGKFLYVKPRNACVVSLDGQNISLIANKTSKFWANFTQVTLEVSGEPNSIVLVIAGD
jgi:hypothetical protein